MKNKIKSALKVSKDHLLFEWGDLSPNNYCSNSSPCKMSAHISMLLHDSLKLLITTEEHIIIKTYNEKALKELKFLRNEEFLVSS